MLCCGSGSFYAQVKDEMGRFSEEAKKFGKVSSVTGVQHAEVGQKRHGLYRSAGSMGATKEVSIMASSPSKSAKRSRVLPSLPSPEAAPTKGNLLQGVVEGDAHEKQETVTVSSTHSEENR